MRYKLIKPIWAKKTIRGNPNPNFIKMIPGEDNIEGKFTESELKSANDAGFNIYFFPNYPSKMPKDKKYTQASDIDVFTYVFVDMDLKEGVYKSKDEFYQKLSEFELEPTMVVDSGNGVHAYWEVSDLNPRTYCIIQKLLIQKLTTDAAIWGLKQLMRVPGYNNTKDPNNPKLAAVVHQSDKVYTVNELLSVLPSITNDIEKEVESHFNKAFGIINEEDEELDQAKLPIKFIELMKQEKFIHTLFKNPTVYKGDRSSADMKLTNELFEFGFTKNEVEEVIVNTQKARSKSGSSRINYVKDTVRKVFRQRCVLSEPSVAELMRSGSNSVQLGRPIHGPAHFDCLIEPWRAGEVIGLILGTGVGKTTLSLYMIKEILKNNPSERAIFFSLEMSKAAIVKKWSKLTKNNTELSERFHIVSNDPEDGNIRHINLQEIVWVTEDIKRSYGDNIACICIDHMSEISREVDLSKEPTFGASGYDTDKKGKKSVTLTYEEACLRVKDMAKLLDTFIIMQSQTRREYDKMGDIPIYKDGAYGTSNFEKMVHYVMTGWQPLMRVADETRLKVTAWQYCKIRSMDEDDEAKINSHYLLKFIPKTEDFALLTKEDMAEFETWKSTADQRRKEHQEEGEGGAQYKNSPIRKLRLIAEAVDKKVQKV